MVPSPSSTWPSQLSSMPLHVSAIPGFREGSLSSQSAPHGGAKYPSPSPSMLTHPIVVVVVDSGAGAGAHTRDAFFTRMECEPNWSCIDVFSCSFGHFTL